MMGERLIIGFDFRLPTYLPTYRADRSAGRSGGLSAFFKNIQLGEKSPLVLRFFAIGMVLCTRQPAYPPIISRQPGLTLGHHYVAFRVFIQEKGESWPRT